MCGIGGIFTELYKDVTFRIVPIERIDAEEMIEEIKGKKLLEGFRNIPANKQLVIDLLLKVSKIGEELMDRIDQMDLNPVFVYGDDLCVVDAKLILK
jgi:acyl-CoA synthetase (NDP forming)